MDDNKLLIVDDEKGIAEMIETILKKEGFFNIDVAYTGKDAIEKIKEKNYELILLDVMLPDINGFEVCTKARNYTAAPILFLTAKTSDLDKLTGLGIGGDDYITKPFNPLEVVARIKVQFRRNEQFKKLISNENEKTIKFANVLIDKMAAQVLVDGEEIYFPAKEYELLLFFAEHPNQVFTSEQLYEKIWGLDSLGDDKTVSVHVGRIRKKIEKDMSKPEIIINLRGIGYKLVDNKEVK
ncbi:response regulator [Streptococcus dentiloxodontae]